MIFEADEEAQAVAVIGHYEVGVANLLRFLERVLHPAAADLAEKAQEFLGAASNRNRYFLLEPGEVFELGNNSPGEQMDDLLAQLANLGPQMDKAIAELETRML